MNIDDVVLEIAKNLVNCYNNKSSIVFPEYHNEGKEKYRISEQESKVLFTNEFICEKIKFAVEVPTKSKHKQKGKTELSARFDLVTYRDNTYDFDWVIELKKGNPPAYSFQKDFEKMVKSKSNCVWFHTLKDADDNTYESLFENKINSGINKVIKDFEGKHTWKFFIVVLEKAELYSLDISMEKYKYDEIKSIKQFKQKDLKTYIK